MNILENILLHTHTHTHSWTHTHICKKVIYAEWILCSFYSAFSLSTMADNQPSQWTHPPSFSKRCCLLGTCSRAWDPPVNKTHTDPCPWGTSLATGANRQQKIKRVNNLSGWKVGSATKNGTAVPEGAPENRAAVFTISKVGVNRGLIKKAVFAQRGEGPRALENHFSWPHSMPLMICAEMCLTSALLIDTSLVSNFSLLYERLQYSPVYNWWTFVELFPWEECLAPNPRPLTISKSEDFLSPALQKDCQSTPTITHLSSQSHCLPNTRPHLSFIFNLLTLGGESCDICAAFTWP